MSETKSMECIKCTDYKKQETMEKRIKKLEIHLDMLSAEIKGVKEHCVARIELLEKTKMNKWW